LNARLATISILETFEKSGSQLKIIRDQFFHRKKMSNLDRQRTTVLTNEIVRWLPVIDSIYAPYLQYPLRRLDSKVKAVLRLGVYESVMDSEIPDYAAIHSAVETTKSIKKKKASGLVNAVLRKVIQKNAEKPYQEMEHLKEAFPHWLSQKWIKQFGQKKTLSLMDTFMKPRPIFIRIDSHLGDVIDDLHSREVKLKILPENEKIHQIEKGASALVKSPSFEKGYFSIQDPGSAAIVTLLDPKEDETILDVCAAPGTKSYAIAKAMNGKGNLFLSDSDQKRIEMAKKGGGRFSFNHISWEQKDATRDTYPMADKILIDAPCSGTGLIGRKPDLKWRRIKEDIHEMQKIQKSILKHMSQFLKPGGVMIYATCSIEPEENWEVVEDFLKLNDGFEIESAEQWIPSRWLDDNHCLFTWPSQENTDGLFGARLKKI
jgi:16S rRNA (cytosine967-C5)-methyltransferase